MSDTLEENDWGVHGGSLPDTCRVVYGNRNECDGTNALAERNYACDSHILSYFGETPLDDVGEHSFKSQLYQCMLSQALWIKGQLELFRSTNGFGTLVRTKWQVEALTFMLTRSLLHSDLADERDMAHGGLGFS